MIRGGGARTLHLEDPGGRRASTPLPSPSPPPPRSCSFCFFFGKFGKMSSPGKVGTPISGNLGSAPPSIYYIWVSCDHYLSKYVHLVTPTNQPFFNIYRPHAFPQCQEVGRPPPPKADPRKGRRSTSGRYAYLSLLSPPSHPNRQTGRHSWKHYPHNLAGGC